jgi:hypothetical protein
MRSSLFWSTIVIASTAAGAAAAADNLKGTYSFVGAQVCLVAPAGFKQDSNGNFTIPIGETNLSELTAEGQVIYHADGTGEARQTFVTIVHPILMERQSVRAQSLTRSPTRPRVITRIVWPSSPAPLRVC